MNNFLAVIICLIFILSNWAITYFCVNPRSKKKIKTSEIKIKVEFVRKHDKSETSFTQVFSNYDLTQCIKTILCYTKLQHCWIKSMQLLTTE